jgi:hypothetical protein
MLLILSFVIVMNRKFNFFLIYFLGFLRFLYFAHFADIEKKTTAKLTVFSPQKMQNPLSVLKI